MTPLEIAITVAVVFGIICLLSVLIAVARGLYTFYTDPRVSFNEKIGITALVSFAFFALTLVVIGGMTG